MDFAHGQLAPEDRIEVVTRMGPRTLRRPGGMSLRRAIDGWPAFLARHRAGVAPRLLAYILLFSTVVTIFSTGLQLYFDYRRDVTAIESNLDEIESSYVNILAGSLWNLDVGQLRLQLEGMLRLPGMQAMEVRETSTAVKQPLVVAIGKRGAVDVIVRETPIIRTEGGRSQIIGILRAEATLGGIYHRMADAALLILAAQGVQTFLVSLFGLYIVQRLITRHLSTIAEFVDGYDLRAPARPLRLWRRKPKKDDEFDRVVSAFNNMSTGLQHAYQELREVNAELERDIGIRASYEVRLLQQAHYDELTGLPNRILLLDRLEQAIATARRDHLRTALLCIDLDRFKNINDTLGHAAGDILLKLATARLSGCVRDPDTLARMGGDEFIIILPGIDDDSGAERVATRIIEAFAQPFDIHGQEHFITASIGITLFPEDGGDGTTLLRNADLAMYQAKESGRNGYRFFTHEINQRMQERLAIEARLRGAVARDELVLHYQPIVDLRTGRPSGVEALVRWRQPDGSISMPGQFIPVAEDMGLIKDIGEWVIATACAAMRDHLLGASSLRRVAVNVSPRQLREQGFGAFVERVLARHDLPPECLELEITESVLLDDMPETAVNLAMLCALGVRLSIDDFGTGYSSLGYLQRYPFDTLKIDRSFVTASGHSDNAVRLIETIIAMAHGLGMEVVAEGVETETQLALLRERDCDFAQGYYFKRPVPLDEIALLLENGTAYP
jgi:diguanylate cyclase (GGDEF)-like protein